MHTACNMHCSKVIAIRAQKKGHADKIVNKISNSLYYVFE